MHAADHGFMSRALKLAAKGLWTTDPNPRVGCVLVRDDQVVGEGWHQRAGEPHAEINALRQAGDRARGATAYVTLEPCCHHGRTGPCTEALLSAGVRRVVAAMVDPNPAVAGQGMAALSAAGVKTQTGLLETSAKDLNLGFCSRMTRGVPWVRAKLAMSLDGRTAMPSGESQWITGAAARRDVQRLRARSSAVLTGVATVIADNPSLNVRADALGLDPETSLRQPLRVIVDSNASTPGDAKLLALPGRTMVAVCTQPGAATDTLAAAGADVAQLPTHDGRIDLRALLKHLGDQAINEVLVESGPTLAGALLQAGCVDEVVVYLAPRLLGDAARGLFTLPGLEQLAAAPRLQINDVRRVGEDLRLTARVLSQSA